MAPFTSAAPGLEESYAVLGLGPKASKAEVKEAFVKLCKVHHPDRVSVSERVAAEGRFREIKSAYDAILRGQAGYSVPPPGTAPNAKYSREYYRAHGMGMDFGEGGPVRCGGSFGGYATETDFYRAMFRTSRNNPFLLIMSGLLAIPCIAFTVSLTNGNTEWIRRFRNEGLHMFGPNALRVNGRDAVGGINPFAIRSLHEMQDSYIYKDAKYAHLRRRAPDAAPDAGGGGEGAPA